MSNTIVLSVALNATPGAPLKGCLNDSRNFLGAVKNRLGKADVFTLYDKGATLAAYRDLLLNHIIPATYASPAGLLVEHNSSHGTQVPVGIAAPDEPDAYDEARVFYDYRSGGLLIDDEERALMSLINPHWKVRQIKDNCHSGSSLRGFFGFAPHFVNRVHPRQRARVLPTAQIPRATLTAVAEWLEPPLQREPTTRLYQQLRTATTVVEARLLAKQLYSALTKNKFKGVVDHPDRLLLAACQASQTCADAYINNSYQGAHTWAMLKAWGEMPGETYQQIRQRTATLLKGSYDQLPQLEMTNPAAETLPFLRG